MTSYKLRVSGLNLHHAIEFFEKENIPLKDVEKHDTSLTVTLSKQDYLTFKKSPIFSTYKVRILKVFGAKKLLSSLLSRLGLFVGAIIVVLSVLNITSFVMQVEIVNENHHCENGEDCIFVPQNLEKVRLALEKLNVKSGTSVKSIPSPRTIERELSKQFPQISAVKVEQNGVRVNITILEATLPASMTSTDLISNFNGVVVKLDVSSGEPAVKIGDVVVKGQTLVKKTTAPVSARVTIRAFFHDNMIFDEQQTTYEKTGRKKNFTSLSLFGFSTKTNIQKPFNLYEMKTKSEYAFFNMFLPLKVKTTTIWELAEIKKEVPFDSVKEALELELKQATMKQLPADAERVNVTYTTFREGSRVRLDCYVEALVLASK